MTQWTHKYGFSLETQPEKVEVSERGGQMAMSRQEVFKSDVLLKVAPPTIDEIELLHPDQCVISALQLPTLSESYVDRLLRHRVTACLLYTSDAADERSSVDLG